MQVLELTYCSRLVQRYGVLVSYQMLRRCVPGADPVYPPSLYRAVSYASTLGVPVYILENGMPSKEVRAPVPLNPKP